MILNAAPLRSATKSGKNVLTTSLGGHALPSLRTRIADWMP
jgi:hypothetical protein